MWHKRKQDAVKIVIADIVAFIMVHRLAISTIENRMGGAVFWWCVCCCGGEMMMMELELLAILATYSDTGR